jgi:hypothetical protein
MILATKVVAKAVLRSVMVVSPPKLNRRLGSLVPTTLSSRRLAPLPHTDQQLFSAADQPVQGSVSLLRAGEARHTGTYRGARDRAVAPTFGNPGLSGLML